MWFTSIKGQLTRQLTGQLKDTELSNEILDDNNMGEYNADHNNYTQLQHQSTHKIGDN